MTFHVITLRYWRSWGQTNIPLLPLTWPTHQGSPGLMNEIVLLCFSDSKKFAYYIDLKSASLNSYLITEFPGVDLIIMTCRLGEHPWNSFSDISNAMLSQQENQTTPPIVINSPTRERERERERESILEKKHLRGREREWSMWIKKVEREWDLN